MTDEQRLEQIRSKVVDMSAALLGRDEARFLLSQLDAARQQVAEYSRSLIAASHDVHNAQLAQSASEQREKRLREALSDCISTLDYALECIERCRDQRDAIRARGEMKHES